MSKIFFIATKHPEYQEEVFPAGSIVIDPWRYIPNQSGVDVRRIGENKPELISLLVPSRARPQEFLRMATSAYHTATHPRRLEVIVYRDLDDDIHYSNDGDLPYIKSIRGERIVLSEMWNECYKVASGDILMHCGDDIVFCTDGWDSVVRRTFAESEDKILLVHGDDRSPNTDALATHGFLHRRWVDTVGYFVPPYFSSDWNDVWLTEVADQIGRRVKIPIITEHMHYSFGKAERDRNTEEREERARRDDVVSIYLRTKNERNRDAELLRAVIT